MVNQDKVNNIVGMVRNLIDLTGTADSLTDGKIDELIAQTLSIAGVVLPEEEHEACRRDLKYRYMIQSTPGSKILNDYEQEEWYSEIKDEIDQKFWSRYKNYLIDEKHFSPNIVSKDKEDPTTINKLIRNLANLFTRSNYIGFTATPFANVFIDPETTEDMENQDLFPEDFIVSLPTPSNYIGPEKIFAENGEYHSQLIYISDAGIEEEDGHSFYFKHKKEWHGELPESLTDAIYSFYIVNAIRDLRGDIKTHRSMLINMSRFVKVQKHIRAEVEEIHDKAYREIKFNLSNNFDESMKSPVLRRIYSLWTEHFSDTEFSWEEIADNLFRAIENITIKVVNSAKGTDKLVYPANESVRVIAIGGLALSRGLTLEGLIISYFYRNTCTYDVLMQMGRWFGYRRGYEDLFRIWTHKASAEWYAEISKATEELKADMRLMNENKMRPRDFGIRTKNVIGELGEYLAIQYYNSTSGLPKLQAAPIGTKNIDAISREGDRYSIKSTTGNTTGVFTGVDFDDKGLPLKQYFEFIIICCFDDDYKLLHIYQVDWNCFIKHKHWHSTMKSWNLILNKDLIADAILIK